MRTENEFNAKLSALLKQQKGLFFRKLSDKYQIGMSDFMLIKRGKSVFIECKFKKELKGPLGHPFSGPQLSFMKQACVGGAECFGLIWVASTSKMRLINYFDIPTSGNFTEADFKEPMFKDYDLNTKGIKEMLTYLFGEDNG